MAADVDLTQPVQRVIADLHASLTQARRFDIGFPGAVDLVFPDLAQLLTTHLLNNVGDPYDLGHGRNHTKRVEQQVIDIVGDLLRAPAGRWGYVTTGATEGNLHALDEAWQRYPDALVFCSTASHYSVHKAARLLKLPLIVVRADETGQMDYDDLAGQLALRRDRAAVIVATAGTTMTEAVDDVARIVEVCDRLAVIRRRIHVDAALSGVPLALLPDEARPAFDFTAGATSMVISGHKFLSTLMPCGVLVYAQSPYTPVNGRVSYTGSADTTIAGSRSGHTPLILWHVLRTLGVDGLRADRGEHRSGQPARRLLMHGPTSRVPTARKVRQQVSIDRLAPQLHPHVIIVSSVLPGGTHATPPTNASEPAQQGDTEVLPFSYPPAVRQDDSFRSEPVSPAISMCLGDSPPWSAVKSPVAGDLAQVWCRPRAASRSAADNRGQ